MPRLSQAEIRNNAIAFVHDWKGETRERGESQTFWNEFLQIFGIKRRQVAIFERAVPKNNQNTGAIDLFWRGVLLVEHKSLGKNFDKASSQAFEYLENLPAAELPEYVLISDFAAFRLYNLETNEETQFTLEALPDKIHLFGAISGYQKREYKEQDPVNIKVALKLGELHDALLESGYGGHKLEAFLVRLVYCLFADDTGIFLPRSSLLFFLEEKTAEDGSNLGAMIAQLFQVLDTAESERQTTLDEDLKAFPYVNGALFRERMDTPSFDRRMRRLLIEACEFDWSKVSPAIFGSLFQSVMDKEKRRNLGAHYTSEKNILKVIHGLFLDDLLAEFDNVKNNLNKLRAFHEKIASLRFFDPACGCGNFLVITYREMRRLELAVLTQINALTGNIQSELLVTDLSKIDVDSFYGIEFEEFPSEIARVALWLTDHLANIELSNAFGQPYFRLPLEHSPNIVHGNALRLDWSEVLSVSSPHVSKGSPSRDEALTHVRATDTNLYILGNPPFVGKDKRSDEQTADMEFCCSDVQNFKTLDYVCSWYIKAAKFLSGEASPLDVRKSYAFPADSIISSGGSAAERRHSLEKGGENDGEAELRRTSSGRAAETRVAFVSTNSITQGEQVGVLWQYLLDRGVKIHFAHRTFKWSNEASGKAAVYCVIIGFGLFDVKRKRLFDYDTPKAESHEVEVKNINPYLIDAADLVITSRSRPISNVAEIVFGSKPTDGGHLLLEPEERSEILTIEPEAAKFIVPMVGAHEFINGDKRYCIWLKNANPAEWRGLGQITKRVQAVREFRLKSKKLPTVKLAETPYLFGEIRQPDNDYVLIPLHSSENRKYVPIGFLPSSIIFNNSCAAIPNATLFHFGVLTSTMHNAWMRQVCGRLESRYRYSNNLVYNNFPFPQGVSSPHVSKGLDDGEGALTHVRATDKKHLRVEQTAQAILDARTKFPNATLADLYDPLTMPKELLDAHRANDEAVDACYGSRRFKNELERLEFLFDLYREYTEPLAILEEKETRKAKRKRKTIEAK